MNATRTKSWRSLKTATNSYALSVLRREELAIQQTIAAYERGGQDQMAISYWYDNLKSVEHAIETLNH